MKKSGLVRITALFFALMFCFTILSRAAYQEGTAVVTVNRPENRTIAHTVKTTGKVVQNQELAVVTEPDQRVTAIHVKEGQKVSSGDLLFEIDEKLLDEKILAQQQEMEKQKLQVQDARSQKEVSAQNRANAQAQAAENYSLSTSSANTRLNRAKRDLQKAKEALTEFRKSSGVDIGDSEVEESLEKSLQEKQDAYIQAEQELTQLQWKIEKAVDDALTQAAASASLSVNGTVHTQSIGGTGDILEEPEMLSFSQEEPELPAEVQGISEESSTDFFTGDEDTISMNTQTAGAAEVGLWGDLIEDDSAAAGMAENAPAGIIDNGAEFSGSNGGSSDAYGDEASSGIISDSTGNTGLSANDAVNISGNDAGTSDLILEDETPGESSGADGNGGLSGTGTGDSLLDDGENSGSISSGNSGMLPGTTGQPSGLTQEEKDRIEKNVRASYQQELETARKKVETAKAEKEAAAAALARYQQERLAAAGEQNAQTEQQLIDQVTAARDTYEDAALAANEAAVTSGRAIATAGLPEASNSSDRMNEITYEQMELTLEKLETLKEKGGKIVAPADGLITKINIITGEKTTDTTAILMADLSKGYSLTADITKEQADYMGTGDLVTLTGGSKKKKLEEVEVSSVTEDKEQEGIFRVTVQLPEDAFEIGTAVTLEFTKKSEAYSICVPLSALHLDDKNQPYVLVPDQHDSIMGTEYKARKVSVTVLEQNESYAALAEGALSGQQDVIVNSDKAVDNGSRVRIAS